MAGTLLPSRDGLNCRAAACCRGWDRPNRAREPVDQLLDRTIELDGRHGLRDEAGSQEMPWDPFLDFQLLDHNTQCFLSLWRSYKPTVCKVHGYAVAGGSDIALSCDLVVMAEDAHIGYPPARVWGCPTTMMWVYRVGAERAKRLLFAGDLIDGREAERIGRCRAAAPPRS
jgi:enoyl-CoA hydratase